MASSFNDCAINGVADGLLLRGVGLLEANCSLPMPAQLIGPGGLLDPSRKRLLGPPDGSCRPKNPNTCQTWVRPRSPQAAFWAKFGLHVVSVANNPDDVRRIGETSPAMCVIVCAVNSPYEVRHA